MSRIVFLFITTIIISGCSTTPSFTAPKIGHFVHAGPISGNSDSLSVKWRYGFKFFNEPTGVEKIAFTCPDIPGSTFTVAKSELKINEELVGYWNGPNVSVSNTTTGWLFDSSTTTVICEAKIYIVGELPFSEKAPVNFSGTTKAALLQQLKMAYEFNNRK